MTWWQAVLAAVGWCAFWAGAGYYIGGPLFAGFKPFTTPKQAARGERRLRG